MMLPAEGEGGFAMIRKEEEKEGLGTIPYGIDNGGKQQEQDRQQQAQE